MENKNNNNSHIKSCVDCKTTKTPLWRGGPAGPKSLCNACGIRLRKRKRVMESMNKIKSSQKKKDKTSGTCSTATTVTRHHPGAAANSASGKVDTTKNASSLNIKPRLVSLGKEVLFPRSPLSSSVVVVRKQRCQRRRKLKEEEQAAFSLMALSCGVVFA